MLKLIFTGLCMPFLSTMATTTYHVSFPDAAAHYVRISIELDVQKNELAEMQMPVWTPGSYKVREFSQHVDRFVAIQNGQTLTAARVDKNTWNVKSKAKSRLLIQYDVYAFDYSVRTSYVDLQKAFIHGVSAFMLVKGREKDAVIINIEPLQTWKDVFVALPPFSGNKFAYYCENYDLLADSPIAIGNFEHTEYTCGGTVHHVVMIGKGNYKLDKIREDFKRISDEELKMFGTVHPSPVYVHFIQNVDNGGGGLEHLNSQTSQVNRWAYSDEKKYLSFLGLVAHEYFHLWNVKRIRPVELGPFDYNVENYTDMLWIAEGITSYFDDLILLRCGFHTQESYFQVLANAINRFENLPGKEVMTLAESSKLAWVKGYYPNENSDNVSISYYNKGMLVAWILDLEIMKLTNGAKCLDDVMKALFQQYEKEPKGFTFASFQKTCNDIAGTDLESFFKKYVYSLTPIPYASYLKDIGITMSNTTDINKADIGAKAKADNSKSILTYIHPAGAAIAAGLSVNDEIIAIDGWRVKLDMADEISRLEVGKEVEVIYARDGKIHKTTITPQADQSLKYKVELLEEMSDSQKLRQNIWLSAP